MTSQSRWNNPGDLLACSGSYWTTCALHAAVDLNLVTLINTTPKTAAEVADASQTDPTACEQLLNALCSIGLLESTAAGYSATDFSLAYLHKSSPTYLGHIILHHKKLMANWSQLSTAVRTGAPLPSQLDAPCDLKSFLLGMVNLGTMNAPAVLDVIDLNGKNKLLDIGSGPGAYAIHFCQHYPDLHAIMFDRETTKPFAKEQIKRYAIEDRVRFMSGDFICDDIGRGYDVIWGSHILHSNSPHDVQVVIAKLFDALSPGGELFIQEFILDDSKCSPEFPALFSLNMLLHTPEGRSYSQGELDEMMRDAGFKHLARLEPGGTASIISAQKPL